MAVENITTLKSDDGTVYLRTQHGRSAEEIAESLKPYIGRTMSMEFPNLYGHYRRYSGVLREIDGVVATVYVPRHSYETEVNVFDAFGSHCTMIEKES
jgi:hypothetical protein